MNWQFIHSNKRDHGTILANNEELWFERFFRSQILSHCDCLYGGLYREKTETSERVVSVESVWIYLIVIAGAKDACLVV